MKVAFKKRFSAVIAVVLVFTVLSVSLALTSIAEDTTTGRTYSNAVADLSPISQVSGFSFPYGKIYSSTSKDMYSLTYDAGNVAPTDLNNSALVVKPTSTVNTGNNAVAVPGTKDANVKVGHFLQAPFRNSSGASSRCNNIQFLEDGQLKSDGFSVWIANLSDSSIQMSFGFSVGANNAEWLVYRTTKEYTIPVGGSWVDLAWSDFVLTFMGNYGAPDTAYGTPLNTTETLGFTNNTVKNNCSTAAGRVQRINMLRCYYDVPEAEKPIMIFDDVRMFYDGAAGGDSTEAPTQAPETEAPTEAPTQAPTQAPAGQNIPYTFDDSTTVPANITSIRGQATSLTVEADAAGGNELKIVTPHTSTGLEIKNISAPEGVVGFKFDARTEGANAQLNVRFYTPTNLSKNVIATTSEQTFVFNFEDGLAGAEDVQYMWIVVQKAVTVYFDNFQWIYASEEPTTEAPTEAPTTQAPTTEAPTAPAPTLPNGDTLILDADNNILPSYSDTGWNAKGSIVTNSEYANTDNGAVYQVLATNETQPHFLRIEESYFRYSTGMKLWVNANVNAQVKFTFCYKAEGDTWLNTYAHETPVEITAGQGQWITYNWVEDMPEFTNEEKIDTTHIRIEFTTETAVKDETKYFVDDITMFYPETISPYNEKVVFTAKDNELIEVTVENKNPDRTYHIWELHRIEMNADGEDVVRWCYRGETYAEFYPTPIDGAYKVMVVVVDSTGATVDTKFGEAISFTDIDAGKAHITSVKYNGITKDSLHIDLADDEATTVRLTVDTINADAVKVTTAEGVLTADANGELMLDFKGYAPGKHTITITASNDNTTDTQKVDVWVYGSDFEADPVIATGAQSTGVDNVFTITALTDATDCWFSVGSQRVSGNVATITYEEGKYGIYDVYGYLKSSQSTSYYDDVIYVQNVYKRPGVDFKVNVERSISGDDAVFNVEETLSISASTVVTGDYDGEIMYQFYRNDARGWVVVQDWSTKSTYEWTAPYAGNYVYQVRVKGEGAGSYEAFSAFAIDVVGNQKAVGTLSLDTVNATARKPVTLKAILTGGAKNDRMQYRFRVTDKTNNVPEVIKPYNADATCVWVPRKPGTFEIAVEAINQNSFGMYDIQYIENVTVQ